MMEILGHQVKKPTGSLFEDYFKVRVGRFLAQNCGKKITVAIKNPQFRRLRASFGKEHKVPYGIIVSFQQGDELFYGLSIQNEHDKWNLFEGWKWAVDRAVQSLYSKLAYGILWLWIPAAASDRELCAYEELERVQEEDKEWFSKSIKSDPLVTSVGHSIQCKQ